VPDTAEVVASFDDPYWHFPAITRNRYGSGSLTYEATVVTGALQREILRDVLQRAGLTGPDQSLPGAVKVRHGQNAGGKTIHYYFNFSGLSQSISYPYRRGTDLLTSASIHGGQTLTLKPWNLAIVAEE